MIHRTLAVAAFISLLGATAAQADPLRAGPMVGAVGADHALIWAQASEAGGSLRVRVLSKQGAEVASGTSAFGPARGHAATVRVQGLEPASSYLYEVLVDDEVVGERQPLRTLPKPGTGAIRIAFGSCLKRGFEPQQPIFDVIAAARPDVFLWLGDNCYYSNTDALEPGKLWEVMRETRALPSLRALLAKTSNLATWDDHDFGPNNSDRTYAHKKHAREVFMAYWANHAYGQEGQGIYSKVSLGPVDVFLCDNRWFRDPNGTPESAQKSIFGPRQRAWLIEGLAASKAPIKLVASGGQFLARYHEFESHNSARHERDAIVAALRERAIPGVVFLSGDRHLAEVTRWRGATQGLGYDLWDVTSSPLSNRSWPDGAKHPNPEREFSYGETPNFGWIEVDAATKTVTLELRGPDGKRLWSVAPEDLYPVKR